MIPGEIAKREFTRGDTFTENLLFKTLSGETEIPVDLTTYTDIVMDLRRGKDRYSPVIHTFTLVDGLEISGADNNKLIINYSTEITDTLAGGNYYRDIRFITGGNIETYLTGLIQVRENITMV